MEVVVASLNERISKVEQENYALRASLESTHQMTEELKNENGSLKEELADLRHTYEEDDTKGKVTELEQRANSQEDYSRKVSNHGRNPRSQKRK